MNDRKPRALECEACGVTLRKLTAAEAKRVAESPYDYVAYCAEHRDYWKVEARRYGLI